MITIRGKYTTAKIFTDELEDSAEDQISTLCNQSCADGSKIRIMPDVHTGAGCAIGTTMTITDKVVPNLVGVDIGCGMETVRLEQKRIDLPKLDSLIHERIPSGMDVRDRAHRFADDVDIEEMYCASRVKTDRGYLSVGTLGGGNHFIEVAKDDQENLYLVVHSGSRNIGLQVAQHYQQAGYDALGGKGGTDVPFPLAYVEGRLMDEYMHDMRIMQEFAEINRKAITDEILRGMNLSEADRFTTIHNYIDIENWILRKGAVSAKVGERLLIPINMRDGSLICIGRGNEDWNESAPHGAGRLMSRTAAKNKFTVSSFIKEMAGVFTTTVSDETLDECPMAYKSMDDIVRYIADTVNIVTRIHPVYNFKAGENHMQLRRKDRKGRDKRSGRNDRKGET